MLTPSPQSPISHTNCKWTPISIFFLLILVKLYYLSYEFFHSRSILWNTSADLKTSIFNFSYKVQGTPISICFSICMNSFLYDNMDVSFTPHCGDHFESHKDVVCHKILGCLLRLQQACICHKLVLVNFFNSFVSQVGHCFLWHWIFQFSGYINS